MLARNVIESLQMEWAAPIVFSPIIDKTLRLCIEYRILTAITFQVSYPIPHKYHCIDYLGKAIVVSILGASSWSWQTKIDGADTLKTASTSNHRLYRFVHMSLEIRKPPGTLQLTIDVLMSSAEWKFDPVYFDDIVVFRKMPQQHIDHVCEVHSQLHSADATLKETKCKFFMSIIDFFGQVARPWHLKLAPNTTTAIRGLQ